jgi:plastocyanin
MSRTRIYAASLVLLLAAACGGDTSGQTSPKPTATVSKSPKASPTPTSTPTGGDRVELEVEAEDFAFDRGRVRVPAGAAIELKFKNRDADIPHTFSVYETEAAEQQIFSTGNLIGDREKTYDFTAPSEAGTYFFRCDVHPDMNGDFVVE